MRYSFFVAVFLLVINWTVLSVAQEAAPLQPKDFKAGKEYFEMSAPLYAKDDGRVEVLSFYWYNCGACLYLEPKLAAWAKELPPEKVRFVSLPFGYQGPAAFHAQLAFALEDMGLGQEGHRKVFDLFQKQHQHIYTPEELPQFAKAMGIDEKKLIKSFNSPQVAGQMAQLVELLNAYDLSGVPSMVIDGKYRFDTGTAHGAKGFLGLADLFIEQQQQERN